MSVRLGRARLSIAAAERELRRGPGGGVALFAGRVRADRLGRARVTALDYEADRAPALVRLGSLEREARRRFGARAVVLWHRLGRVPVGEVSVVVGATCAHRDAAFRAARHLIERLKVEVPIWKAERARPSRRRRGPPRRPGRRSAG